MEDQARVTLPQDAVRAWRTAHPWLSRCSLGRGLLPWPCRCCHHRRRRHHPSLLPSPLPTAIPSAIAVAAFALVEVDGQLYAHGERAGHGAFPPLWAWVDGFCLRLKRCHSRHSVNRVRCPVTRPPCAQSSMPAMAVCSLRLALHPLFVRPPSSSSTGNGSRTAPHTLPAPTPAPAPIALPGRGRHARREFFPAPLFANDQGYLPSKC